MWLGYAMTAAHIRRLHARFLLAQDTYDLCLGES